MSLKVIIQYCIRLWLIWIGAVLAAIEPVSEWVDERRAANTAIGHVPNMDPSVMLLIALFLMIPIIIVVLCIEIGRWRIAGKPLSYPACLALGLLAGCPVGYSIYYGKSASQLMLYSWSAGLIATFYAIRYVWRYWRN